MARVPVVLISDIQYRWDLLFATIDFDYITISAIYGDINQLRSEWRTQLETVFRPIEYFGSECGKYNKTYFIFNTFGDNIRRYLKQNNIDEQYIISLEYPEERFQNVLLYYAQYKFLEKNKPPFDFFATGISFTRDGFDVPSMLPWKGVTFAFPMQDLYYSYQIAKKYLSSCINRDVVNSRGGGIRISLCA